MQGSGRHLDYPGINRFRSHRALLLLVMAAALLTRFWRLDTPDVPIFDENLVLSQAGSYIRGWPYFVSLQPPLAKLLTTLSVLLLGDNPWGWRTINASLGVGLVAISYALAQQLFRSRPAALLAAALILLDGLFLVVARTAMINSFYITLEAAAYLILFRFLQAGDWPGRRRLIFALALVLGLGVGAKTIISVVTGVLVLGFLIYDMFYPTVQGQPASSPPLSRQVSGLIVLMAGVTGFIYLAAFLPYYLHGWWHGIGDMIAYHQWILYGNAHLPDTARNSSPFWSWPLLLRAFPYWKQEMPDHRIAVVLCGGNPILWWEIPFAIWLIALRAWRTRDRAMVFILVGYAAYFLMWIPVPRFLLIYDYLPAAYLGLLALAFALGESFEGRMRPWEQVLLLIPIAAALIIGFGPAIGMTISLIIVLIQLMLSRRGDNRSGQFVCGVVLGSAALAFIYFYPIWTGELLSAASYNARTWFNGPGLANWQ